MINSILERRFMPSTLRAEASFTSLQERYKSRQEYGYDRFSLFERASMRAVQLLKQMPRDSTGLKVMDVGSGDGMLGVVLKAAGHDVTLCDLNDWRVEAAKSVEFVRGDCCVAIPRPSEVFDVVCSFNAFEYLLAPDKAFGEILRVTAPGGLIYLDFGPLYASSWGLHAYRSLRMPYPQFLFSPSFIDRKLRELGIEDLGPPRSELQTLNKWKLNQYRDLWQRADLSMMELRGYRDDENLNIIFEYPECFVGRELTYHDVTCSGLVAVLRRH
jgi:SAM-dependent methyltransferase